MRTVAIASLFSLWLTVSEFVSVGAVLLRNGDRSLQGATRVNHIHSLYPSKQIPYHWFGEAVALENNMAIVGAPGAEDFSNYGVAYVYYRTNMGREWQEIAVLEPPTKGVYASFGAAVSIYEGCAFVGAPKDDSGGTDSGVVYFFSGNQGSKGSWVVEQALKPNDLEMQDYFGHSIAQYRRRHVLIGAWGADSSPYASIGAAYLYKYSSDGWKLETKLSPGDAVAYQWFGISVGMAEDLAVVGAWGTNGQDGTVFIYRYSDKGGWHYIQNLFGSNQGNFGYSLAICGDVLAVGAPNSYRTTMGNSINTNAIRTGMVSIYRMKDFNHFEFEQNIQCDTCTGADRFGKTVAVTTGTKYGYRVLIGQKKEAHLYEYDSSRNKGYRWYFEGFVESGYDAENSYYYGSAVAMYGKTMLLGVKDHSESTDMKFAEAGTVIALDSDDGSDIDVEAIENSFHFTLYICLYTSIVLGIAVILVVPLGLFVKHALQDPVSQVDKNKVRERRPFISFDHRQSTSFDSSSISRNKIKGSLK